MKNKSIRDDTNLMHGLSKGLADKLNKASQMLDGTAEKNSEHMKTTGMSSEMPSYK